MAVALRMAVVDRMAVVVTTEGGILRWLVGLALAWLFSMDLQKRRLDCDSNTGLLGGLHHTEVDVGRGKPRPNNGKTA
jgi:hypothetical protein